MAAVAAILSGDAGVCRIGIWILASVCEVAVEVVAEVWAVAYGDGVAEDEEASWRLGELEAVVINHFIVLTAAAAELIAQRYKSASVICFGWLLLCW